MKYVTNLVHPGRVGFESIWPTTMLYDKKRYLRYLPSLQNLYKMRVN